LVNRNHHLHVHSASAHQKELSMPQHRRTMPPERLIEPLRSHLARVKVLHERDLAEGFGEVSLPFALARKYPRRVAAGPGSTCFPLAADRWIRWTERLE
jgi:hypothetical protein